MVRNMTGINEINQRLSNIGMPAVLNAQNANRLKQVTTRERMLKALARVETANDAGARTFLDKTFQEAGIYPAAPATGNAPTQVEVTAPFDGPTTAPPVAVNGGRDNEPPHSVDVRPNTLAPAKRDRVQHHVYGGKGALTFELDSTVAGVPTVALDGAVSVGTRQYDWANKVRVQFTVRELPVVAATLLGILPQCQFSAHGPNNDKGFAIEWQTERSSYFVKIWQGKGNLRAVPMPVEDAFYVAQIVLRAIQQASPARLDTAGVIATLRALYGRRQA